MSPVRSSNTFSNGSQRLFNNYGRPSPQGRSVNYKAPNGVPFRNFGDPYRSPIPRPPSSPPIPKPTPVFGLGALGKLAGRAIPWIGLGLMVLEGMQFGKNLLLSLTDGGQQNPVGQQTPDSRGIPPFRGGQSVGVQYDIFFGINRSTGVTDSLGSIRRVGMIGNVYSTPVGNTTSRNWYYRAGIGTQNFPAGTEYNLGLNVGAGNTYFIQRVVRVDGQPDIAGDPPAENATPYGRFAPPEVDIPPYAPEYAPPTAPKPSGNPNRNNPPNKDPRKVGTPSSSPFPRSSPSPNGNPSGTPSPTSIPSNSPSASTGLSPSLGVNFAPSPLPPANPDIQSPDTKPRPSEREQTKPNTPNSPQPTPPDLRPELQQLKESQQRQEELLKNIPFLIPSLLANNDLFQQSIKNRAKEGTCEAVQPDQCLGSKLNADKEEIKNKLDANEAAQSGALAAILALIQKILSFLNSTIVDRYLGVANLAVNIHNAAMLTRDIGETLLGVVDNALSLVGLRFTNTEGEQVGISDVINQNFQSLVISLIGAENYTSLVVNWQKANTIYHSAIGIVNTTQSMIDPVSNAVEYGMGNVSKIGNSLKEEGVVAENSYSAMDENVRARKVNRFERLTDTLEGAENIVSNISSITSDAVSIKEDFKQLREDKKAFDDAVNSFTDQDDDIANQIKSNLVTDIPDISLSPAPEEDE